MVLIYTFFKLSGSEKYEEGVLEKGAWITHRSHRWESYSGIEDYELKAIITPVINRRSTNVCLKEQQGYSRSAG